MKLKGLSFSRFLTALLVAAVALVGVEFPASSATVPFSAVPLSGVQFNGIVRSVVLGNGLLYVGGEFTSVTGPNGTFARQRVAAINPQSGDVSPFVADADQRVRALAMSGTRLFIGGDFTTVNGVARSRLAEVNALTGLVSTAFKVSAGSAVRSLAVTSNRLYVAGQFTTIANVPQARLAGVDISLPTAALDLSFRPVVDGTVHAVTTLGGGSTIVAGGEFLTANTLAQPYLVGFTPTGAVTGPTYALLTNYPVLDLFPNASGTRIYAGIGGGGNQVAAFDTTTGTKWWRVHTDGDVQAVALSGGNVYFGFHEGFEGDTTLRLLAADAETGVLESSFRPPMNSFYGVWDITSDSAGLYVGGEFTTVSGVAAGRVARFPGASSPPPPPVDPPPPVNPGQSVDLVGNGSTWSYRYTNDAWPAGWQQAAFDSSSWASGVAPLGRASAGQRTDITGGTAISPNPLTAQFRLQFQVANAAQLANVLASVRADDGVVVYVNGTEIGRSNLNLPSGSTPAQGTYAGPLVPRTSTAAGSPVQFTVPANLLVNGTNTIAVGVHANYRNTPDLSMELKLTALQQ